MDITRRNVTKSLAAGMGAAVVPGMRLAQSKHAPCAPAVACTTRRSGDRPNLLFIMSDQRRTDTMAAYGNTGYQVPVMNNVFGRREYATVRARLAKRITAWQKQTGDKLELPV